MAELTFTANNATTWPLDQFGEVRIVGDDDGIFNGGSYDLTIDQRVNGDGGVLVSKRLPPQRVVLEFLLSDPTQILTLWGRFKAALASGGTLQYDGPNGIRTLTDVILESPNRSRLGKDMGQSSDDTVAVSLIALDPWWYGPTETASGTFGAATAWNAAIPWNSAIPWNGGSSQSLTVLGDAPAKPIIVVTGAATSVSMSVGGVGGWETAAPILSSNYLTVSADPAWRGPHRGPHGLFAGADGPIDWQLLTEGSQLFDLPTGVQPLVFGASGTDGSTAWFIAWAPRWLTP